MQTVVGTQAAPLVQPPSSVALYFRLAVTNLAATVTSLLTNGVVPDLTILTINTPAKYTIGYVDLQSETDPLSVTIRFRDDGGVPTSTLGYVVPGGINWVRVPTHPDNIQVIGAVAGPTYVQCRLGLTGVNKL